MSDEEKGLPREEREGKTGLRGAERGDAVPWKADERVPRGGEAHIRRAVEETPASHPGQQMRAVRDLRGHRSLLARGLAAALLPAAAGGALLLEAAAVSTSAAVASAFENEPGTPAHDPTHLTVADGHSVTGASEMACFCSKL